jgi:hypothetical protein
MAANACKLQGKELATVDTYERYECFLELIAMSGDDPMTNYWIGANDIESEGNFVWIEFGNPVGPFYPLGSGEPNDVGGNEDCVHFGKPEGAPHLMNDIDCANLMYYICE